MLLASLSGSLPAPAVRRCRDQQRHSYGFRAWCVMASGRKRLT
jgi:hypothetical protein